MKTPREIFDPIRRLAVKATPEEIIRQRWIQWMIKEGYPPSLIAVEKELSTLPHLQSVPSLPNRRLDLLAYRKEVVPLLLIECKALPLEPFMMDQLLGYNHYVKAPFVALVNDREILFADCRKEVVFSNRPYGYQELIQLAGD